MSTSGVDIAAVAAFPAFPGPDLVTPRHYFNNIENSAGTVLASCAIITTTCRRQKGRRLVFIVLEGGEKTGKSTVLMYLKTVLDEEGHKVVATREPGGTRLGGRLRELVLHRNMPRILELAIFLVDRFLHVLIVVRPALKSGKSVLCDRFSGSTAVYQGYVRKVLPPSMILWFSRVASMGIEPNLVLLLDAPVEVTRDRLEREATTRFDNLGGKFHRAVRGGFLSLAAKNPDTWAVIDASQSLDAVQEEVLQVVAKRLMAPARKLDSP